MSQSDLQVAEVKNSGRLSIIIPFLLVSLIWGSTWFVIRDQLGVVPGPWSVTYRFAIAAVGMFILALATGAKLRIDKKATLLVAALGIAQFAFNFNFVYLAEHHITSGVVAVIFALLIVPNALLGKLWLGQSVGRGFWLGSAVASAGVALLLVQEYRLAGTGGDAALIGGALTIAAVMCASVSNIIQASDGANRFPLTTMIAWSMLFGAAFDAVFALIVAGPPVVDWRVGYFGGVFYLALVGSVIAFPLYFRLIRDIGPGKAAYTSVLIPVIAMLLSTFFEGYAWSALAAGGAALVLLGLAIAMQSRRPAA